jgi:uncharacterized spore protein YtfJ
MGSYNEELEQAGVLLDLAGLLPNADAVLVKVRAASVNAADWHVLRGKSLFSPSAWDGPLHELEAGRMENDTERREQSMEVQDVIAQARDTLTVKRVFGEPYEKDGVTIIPAARIQGGAGGGSGEDPDGQGKGSGSGFGLTARPVGAFIIRDGELSWRPAVDVNRIVLGGQVVVVVALLTIRAIIKARAKARR